MVYELLTLKWQTLIKTVFNQHIRKRDRTSCIIILIKVNYRTNFALPDTSNHEGNSMSKFEKICDAMLTFKIASQLITRGIFDQQYH